jgi:heparinase II/III-like protein
VRFGQPVLPGTSALGAGDRAVAAPFIDCAAAVREGRFAHYGATLTLGERPDWFPRTASPEWQRALHALDELVAIAVAGATATAPDERRRWYELATSLAGDWARRVPAGHAIAWSVPALARRVRNLLLVQAVFAAELRKDAAVRRDLLATCWEQTEALAAAIPTQPNDAWLIAAANALFLAGRFFDGMEARGWTELGSTTLWAQLREQVREDGGHESRSPVWQSFVLAEYLVTLGALRADNDDVPMWGRKRVKGMADCLARLTHPDGTLTAFETSTADAVWPVAELLATAAIVLHEPSFAVAPALPGVWPLLVTGEAGRRAYAGFSHVVPVPQARALRRTGFFVLAGDPGDAMIVDGAVRPCTDGAAAFGYELAVGGLPLVVGSPVAAERPGPIAVHARSTRARNVLVPATNRTADAATAEIRYSMRDGVQYVSGEVVGFAGLGPEVKYRRRLFSVPGRFWLVTDEILGEGTFTGESYVHLHPDTAVRADCHGRPVVIAAREPNASLTVLVAGVRSLALAGGVDHPEPQGWYAAEGSAWRPAPVVVVRVSGSLPLLTGYALVPRFDTMQGEAPAEVALQGDAFELRASLRLGNTSYELTAVQDEVSLVVRT